MNLKEQLLNYMPYDRKEDKDRKLMLDVLERYDDPFSRECEYHFTASSWVVNSSFTKVLFIYHRLYGSWGWSGGHSDGDDNLLRVAGKELTEETGITSANYFPGIYSLEAIRVNEHMKKGKKVASHTHLNLTFLAVADERERLDADMDETNGAKWFDIKIIDEVVSEEGMIKDIYSKLTAKLKGFESAFKKPGKMIQ